MESVRRCVNCGNPLQSPRQQKYCSSTCNNAATAKRLGNRTESPLNRNLRGAINEYRACLDLMERGYEVYRGINPFCRCDLVVCRDQQVVRVEVKTGLYNRKHQPVFSYNTVSHAQRRVADAVAYVMADGVVFYDPDFTVGDASPKPMDSPL